ncbi:hypothetical protein D3C86_682930 [compost metagenome]
MAITALPNPPSRSDPANFPERADAFMAALPGFADEANALLDEVSAAVVLTGSDATGAAQSRAAAGASQDQAAQSAAEAANSNQLAAQNAGSAGTSAQLAQEWATKLGGPVNGNGFSARHYAELAATVMGLPIFSPGSVPAQNVGLIFIAGEGLAEWDEASGVYEVHRDPVLSAAVQALQGKIAQAFGVGQSWQNVGPNRAFGTNYINSTGRPILVCVNGTIAAASASYVCTTNGRFAVRQAWPDSFIGGSVGVTFTVPAGDTFSISQTGISGTTWFEYR